MNAFAMQVRKAAEEDKAALQESGLNFNLFAIVGGQLQDDKEHKLYLLYPEGNWIEITEGSPFAIIGNNGYGKPILDRVIRYDSSMEFALKAGFLSFDATRISANDVDFPIDVVYSKKDSFCITEKRFKKDEFQEIIRFWDKRLSESINDIPEEWINRISRQDEINMEGFS